MLRPGEKASPLFLCSLTYRLQRGNCIMAIFTVTTLNDESNGSTGGLSLREAIQLANARTGADTINFAVNGSIALSLGELLITDDLTINGDTNGDGTPNITIDANQTSRVLKIDDGSTANKVVTLNGLTVTGGRVNGGTAPVGAGIQNFEALTVRNSSVTHNLADESTYGNGSGGGIHSFGTLTVINSQISENTFDGGFESDGGGGGIYSLGTLTVINSTITRNRSTGNYDYGGGGIAVKGSATILQSIISDNTLSSGPSSQASGAGIVGRGSLSIFDSVISGNRAGSGVVGGGISSYGTLVLTNSTVTGNSAGDYYASGGGIYATGDTFILRSTISNNSALSDNFGRSYHGGIDHARGMLSIVDSTVSGNQASFGSGGISTYESSVEIINSTISGNQVLNEEDFLPGRGGISVLRNSTVTISNSTITNNAAPSTGSGVFVLYADSVTVNVASSIIAGNAGSDVDFSPGSANPFVSQGNNLIGTGNAVGTFNKATDITGVTDPGLAPLADNGGPTQTHAILATSPAFNGGRNPLGLGNDQRGTGFNRVEGSAADIGAFEANTIRGSSKRDRLTGTAFADIIIGTAKGDTITTGAGFDQIVYSELWQRGDVIRDFEVGLDKLVFAELLDNIDYSGSNPIADGVVRFARSGSNTIVRIDRDGFGNRFGAQDFVTLRNVSVAEANSADNFIF
jgi:CSLREA domain-containing protein